MFPIFYYFLKKSSNGEVLDNPILTEEYLGDIGDYIIYKNVGYIIIDYAVEVFKDSDFQDNINEDIWR